MHLQLSIFFNSNIVPVGTINETTFVVMIESCIVAANIHTLNSLLLWEKILMQRRTESCYWWSLLTKNFLFVPCLGKLVKHFNLCRLCFPTYILKPKTHMACLLFRFQLGCKWKYERMPECTERTTQWMLEWITWMVESTTWTNASMKWMNNVANGPKEQMK